MIEYSNLAQIASDALLEELKLYPKAGLVSQYDNGSHQDMDYALFIASINSLSDYFTNLVTIATTSHSFDDLKALGIEAEKKMLVATNNINTHRGAIFSLGIVIPSIVEALKNNQSLMTVEQIIVTKYAKDIQQHQPNQLSHGSMIRKQYPVTSIIELAALGFPIVFQALDYLSTQLTRYKPQEAYLLTFYYIMSKLDDTNIIYRGGMSGLKFAQNHANEIIKLTNYPDIYAYALYLHQRFIEKNLSAGGCADILSIVLLLHKVSQQWA